MKVELTTTITVATSTSNKTYTSELESGLSSILGVGIYSYSQTGGRHCVKSLTFSFDGTKVILTLVGRSEVSKSTVDICIVCFGK